MTILLLWTVWLHVLANGHLPVGERARVVFARLNHWVPVLTVASYLVVALVTQLALDWLMYL